MSIKRSLHQQETITHDAWSFYKIGEVEEKIKFKAKNRHQQILLIRYKSQINF